MIFLIHLEDFSKVLKNNSEKLTGGINMAQIIENSKGRRSIRLNAEDIISIVREYQNIIKNDTNYCEIRKKLLKIDFFLPEDI